MPIKTTEIPAKIIKKVFWGGNPSTKKGNIEPTKITVPINIENPKDKPIWLIALPHIITPIPHKTLAAAILNKILVGTSANTTLKSFIRRTDATIGTKNMVNIKKSPHVFSNLKSFVNFSGKAYRPNISPATIAKIIPSIIIIKF